MYLSTDFSLRILGTLGIHCGQLFMEKGLLQKLSQKLSQRVETLHVNGKLLKQHVKSNTQGKNDASSLVFLHDQICVNFRSEDYLFVRQHQICDNFRSGYYLFVM